jgi:acyl carrier protein
MDKQEIEQKVIQAAADVVGVDRMQVTRDHHFVNDLNYDSLDRIEFAMKLEEMFDLRVEDEEVEKIETVGQAIDQVVKMLEELLGTRK